MIEHHPKNSAAPHKAYQAQGFTAKVELDQEIGSEIISLHYTDEQNPQHSLLVSIAPELGSNMFRFRVGTHDLIYCEKDLLQHKDFTGNFVLWPLPNRVRDKRYTYKGHDYSLADVKCPQGNEVLIHGLVFNRAWQYEEPIIKDDSASVTTYVEITPESPHYAAYPFASRLSLTYTLTKNGLTTTYQVHNKGQQTLPFGFALHPYFSLLSGPDETYVSIAANAVMEADNELLPTGRVLDVNTLMYAMFDLRQATPEERLKLDHVYTNVHEHAPAIIDYKKHKMQLQITATEDFTHVVIFAPGNTPFFCLEHQTCSTDAINLHNQGPELQKIAHLQEVEPGTSSNGSIHYQVKFL